MKLDANATCYACEARATSVEHAPPQCVFPAKGEVPGDDRDWRTNLIQVPACREHNGKKSHDDEYFACFVAQNTEGSPIALALFQGPRLRAMMRREGSLGRRIFRTARPALHPSGKQTLAISYEMARVNRVVELTARALYFHDTGKRLIAPCKVFCPTAHRDSGHAASFANLKNLSEGMDTFGRTGDPRGARFGTHPEIFWYQRPEGLNCTRMMFYSTFEFFVMAT